MTSSFKNHVAENFDETFEIAQRAFDQKWNVWRRHVNTVPFDDYWEIVAVHDSIGAAKTWLKNFKNNNDNL